MNNEYNNYQNNNTVNPMPQQPVAPVQPQPMPQQPVAPVAPVQPQPVYQQPVPVYNNPAPEKKKSKLWIIIVGIVIVAAIIIGIKFIAGGGSGASYIAPTAEDTHKGIVYLDPTNLNKSCSEKDVKRNVNEYGTPTGISTGCMKFYIYDDSGDTYKMIVDHNIATNIYWTKSEDVEATGVTLKYGENFLNYGPITANSKLAEITKDWAGNPRLISTAELAKLIDPDNTLEWDASTYDATYPHGTAFYFDMEYNEEKVKYKHSDKSKYAWLYDYTYECTNWGCNIEDNNKYPIEGDDDQIKIEGYWTSDPAIDRKYYVAYDVDWGGSVGSYGISGYNGVGLRPVIELKKDLIK